MIYLDNAATTWPKPSCVREAVRQALELYGANPGRGGHAMGMAASQEIYRCRETAARFFHLENPAHVVFTLNCTMALNMVLKGLLCEGGHIVVSSLEHNAVMRPLKALSAGAPVYSVATVVPENPEETVRNFRRCITPQTKALLCIHASNVFGCRLPIRRIGEMAHRLGLLFIVDAAQSAGVLPVDMEADHIDYLCVPGHKGLYGPMGTGMLLCGPDTPLPTLMEGGTGSQSLLLDQPEELPDRLESGTVNTPGTVSYTHLDVYKRQAPRCGGYPCNRRDRNRIHRPRNNRKIQHPCTKTDGWPASHRQEGRIGLRRAFQRSSIP